MRWRFPTLSLLAALAGPAAAQSPQDRLTLDQFRDSLAVSRDTTALRTLFHALARRNDDPMSALKAGCVALRRTALGADRDASDARDVLRRLTAREPGWPYAWHALADAEMRRAEWQRADSLELGNRVGTGTLERALAHERRALAADPTFAPAALTLASLALGLRDTAFYTDARDALRRADGAGATPSADLLLARGRLERAAGDEDSAAAVFARGAAGAPGTAAELARLELARTRLAVGTEGGDSAYYAGASSGDGAVIAAYRADLAPIAAETDLARFDGLRGAARAAWLHRFWTDRDHAELRADGERIREHYRRLLYARRHFALTVARRFYGARDAYRSGSEELDDRGVIYVRHGEPGTRLKPFVFGLMPNETWRYGRADGDLLFHFSAGYDESGGGDLYDYRLVESVLDLRGASGAPWDQLLLSRQSLSPMYGRMLNWGPYGAARARGQERGIGRASIDYGTTTDSYELQYARRLTAFADLVAVGEQDGLPLAHFVFAIAAPETTPTPAPNGGVVYPVRVRLVALDGAEHAVARVDTAFDIHLGRALERGEYLIGRAELAIPAGGWSWRAAIEQRDDAGLVLPRDTIRVAPVAPGLALSDLALGIRAASARWPVTPADTVLLTPFTLFPERSEVELYYEARGAVPGASYRHRVAVYRVKGGGRLESRPVVALGFQEPAGAPLVRAHRTLQLGKLKPGRYVVEVELSGAGGPAQSRRREILVVKR